MFYMFYFQFTVQLIKHDRTVILKCQSRFLEFLKNHNLWHTMSCSMQFGWKEVSILPVQWHALCLGLFASIIAPFGGFFASGFKRAFKIKVCSRYFCFSNQEMRKYYPFRSGIRWQKKGQVWTDLLRVPIFAGLWW